MLSLSPVTLPPISQLPPYCIPDTFQWYPQGSLLYPSCILAVSLMLPLLYSTSPSGFYMNFPWYLHCISALCVSPLYYSCISIVSKIYLHCIPSVSPLHPSCISFGSQLYLYWNQAVALLYPSFISIVSWVYLYYIPAASPLYSSCISIISLL